MPPASLRRSDQRIEEVNVVRSVRGEQQHYRVVDSVVELTAEDWHQVVAVFVFNPQQQFIGWPNEDDPAAICRKYCAFHLQYTDKPIYPDLESLRLNILSLPEDDRSQDTVILRQFWRKLDQYMENRNRPTGSARQN